MQTCVMQISDIYIQNIMLKATQDKSLMLCMKAGVNFCSVHLKVMKWKSSIDTPDIFTKCTCRVGKTQGQKQDSSLTEAIASEATANVERIKVS